MQKLEGHTDRVYTAQFHPTQPVVATGSADFSIKIWRTHVAHRISSGGVAGEASLTHKMR